MIMAIVNKAGEKVSAKEKVKEILWEAISGTVVEGDYTAREVGLMNDQLFKIKERLSRSLVGKVEDIKE